MKNCYLSLTVLILMVSCNLQAIAIDNLSYYIEHIPCAEKKTKIIVTVSFYTPSTHFDFLLPNTWAGMLNYTDDISDFKALSSNTIISDGVKPYLKKIIHPKNALVKLEYTISKKNNQLFHYYENRVEQDFFHFFGYGVFGYPEMDVSKKTPITLHWKAKKIINSFGKGALKQELHASIQEIKHATYYGGEFNVHTITVNNEPIIIIFKNVSSNARSHVKTITKKIVSAQRRFWNDSQYPFFIVNAYHYDELADLYIGTYVKNAIVIFFNENSARLAENLIFLIAHENWHAWLGAGPLRQENNSALDLWLHEGFSDYYSGITALKSGLITLPQYISYYNEKLEYFFLPPVGKDDFYTKGHILAHEYNLLLKEKESSLDRVMLDLYSRAKKEDASFLNFNTALWLNEMQRYKIDINENNLYPSENALGPCVFLELTKDHVPQYKLNFSLYKKKLKTCLSYFGK